MSLGKDTLQTHRSVQAHLLAGGIDRMVGQLRGAGPVGDRGHRFLELKLERPGVDGYVVLI